MRGNMKAWVVVAIWVWWNAMIGPAWVCPLMVAGQHTLGYPTVSFTIEGVTEDSYTQFIEALRALLKSGEEAHGVPVTRERATVSDDERYALVNISDPVGDSVIFAVDVTNASVVAYKRAENQSSFLQVDIPALFPNTSDRRILPFDSSYTDLESVAEVGRGNIDLGLTPLGYAIADLKYSDDDQSIIARSLIVVNQMVLEAVRFRSIEYRVRRDIPSGESWRADPAMISLEDNWEALSSAIQKSTQGGVFSSEVVLHLINNNPVYVGSVSHAATSDLALMQFVCKSSNQASSNRFIDRLLMRTSSVVDAHVATGADDDDICPPSEPTVRISGRNGLCVHWSDYSDGQPIQLGPCQEPLVVNQLWILREDGTIRSNGKCLTTSGYSPGDYIMIDNCSNAEAAATIWQVWENRTIMNNPELALVLSAESGENGATLTVETNIYASRQGWLPGNHTEPFVTSIIAFNDFCMQANGGAALVDECAGGAANQTWALYPDGSIRPQQDQDQDRCLTISSDNNSQGSIIIISSCSPGSEGQRWVFTNDGRILNLASGMVMEVTGSDPNIIISEYTGNPNQKWVLYF